MNDRCATLRRGFVLWTAIMFVGIAGAAIVALAGLSSFEARRTGLHATDAQLRQALIAAAYDATVHLDDEKLVWAMPLPPSLRELGIAVESRIASIDGDDAAVHIEARMNRRRAEQTITLHRAGDRWRLASAALNEIAD